VLVVPDLQKLVVTDRAHRYNIYDLTCRARNLPAMTVPTSIDELD